MASSINFRTDSEDGSRGGRFRCPQSLQRLSAPIVCIQLTSMTISNETGNVMTYFVSNDLYRAPFGSGLAI